MLYLGRLRGVAVAPQYRLKVKGGFKRGEASFKKTFPLSFEGEGD
jgi:hypothetical protein